MSSSQAYLGAFESKTEVRVTISKEMIEDALCSLQMDDDIIVTDKHWDKIWKAIYESDLVSDFIGGVVELADDIVNEGN
jgi:hypothetical protein